MVKKALEYWVDNLWQDDFEISVDLPPKNVCLSNEMRRSNLN